MVVEIFMITTMNQDIYKKRDRGYKNKFVPYLYFLFFLLASTVSQF